MGPELFASCALALGTPMDPDIDGGVRNAEALSIPDSKLEKYDAHDA